MRQSSEQSLKQSVRIGSRLTGSVLLRSRGFDRRLRVRGSDRLRVLCLDCLRVLFTLEGPELLGVFVQFLFLVLHDVPAVVTVPLGLRVILGEKKT